jgi:hypothetical protein
MIEAKAFLAMFIVQLIVLSILFPARLSGRIQAIRTKYPPHQYPQLYPRGPEAGQRFLLMYRLLNTAVAVAGLGLLVWFFRYTQRPDWDDGPVEALDSAFFLLQMIPVMVLGLVGARANKALRNTLENETRRATLQRRGLFDFVSPLIVFLTVLGYLLFAGFLFYVQKHPFPGFAGFWINIAGVTAIYAAMSFVIYRTMYGMKSNPLQSHADRLRMIEVIVKSCVYSCLACVVFISVNFTLVLLDMQRWEPFAQSASLVAFALLYSMGLRATSDELHIQGLRSRSVS